MVEICAPGMAQRQTTPLRIGDVSRVREDGDPDNPAWLMAKMKWDHIKPAYEAWKKGQNLPEHGTPIGAWSGLTPEQADVFRGLGLRSVEEIANATETVISRAALPNARSLQQQARLWLDGRENSKFAADLEAKDQQIAALREEMEEMKRLVLEEMRAEQAGDDAPRRRGKQAKVEEAAAA
jgi:hypothetical protein